MIVRRFHAVCLETSSGCCMKSNTSDFHFDAAMFVEEFSSMTGETRATTTKTNMMVFGEWLGES